ncbi:bifunctional glycosyltransferase family 2 protein/CDP-glycerol:glycerophosphate glycerophosphotransferase [Actinomadura graeca]|uniref:Bifunctional glycosyltransferase family 2 protein/CDP-glycerol:glycerophosphate glycerophosphotransferase n=1 Tax=Actinomadura graeca TaxID=2750812 RepID=A0ABX8R236_9ACTN|nr:bifunctional glycosyltransferase family 2 protein/CDP-glycerol:glycerophosphate glycerophosphotransferase [Actinomadura graeca]QXJ23757.1 bifunctional glycosyltransferase family 2 protein/CDP-glycerol:glycerophosphate glycerophosphotransferase [Actinomadura graeca]
MSPKLSVVVPFHNTEDYFQECLESLAGQTFRDLEVVMVDDGSTDNGAVIAKDACGRDPRFRLITRDNEGPGPARNAGVREATGTYLAFADADDVVERDAYARLVGSLERTGSDFACGNVERLDGDRSWQSVLHAGLFTEYRARTHVSSHPLLIRDRTSWNKVYRRAFWEKAELSFPSGFYEDPPVMARAHALADSVDVLKETVYYWRKRPGSITEDRYGWDNISQRMRSVAALRAGLADFAPHLLAAFDEHALIDVDLRVLLDALPRTDEAHREALVETGAVLAEKVGPRVLKRFPSLMRLQLHLLCRRMTPELLEVLRFVRLGMAAQAPRARRGLRPRWYAEYPFFEDEERAVPSHVYDVTDELTPVAAIDRAAWVDGRLRIEGHAYIKHLDSSTEDGSRIRVWLLASNRRGLLRVPVQRVRRPDVTARSRQPVVSYDWSGFVAEIDPSSLKIFGRWRDVDWIPCVEIINRGLWRRRTFGNPSLTNRQWPQEHECAPGVLVQAVAGKRRFVLQVRRTAAEVVGCHLEDGELWLDGWSRASLGDEPRITATTRTGRATVLGPIGDPAAPVHARPATPLAARLTEAAPAASTSTSASASASAAAADDLAANPPDRTSDTSLDSTLSTRPPDPSDDEAHNAPRNGDPFGEAAGNQPTGDQPASPPASIAGDAQAGTAEDATLRARGGTADAKATADDHGTGAPGRRPGGTSGAVPAAGPGEAGDASVLFDELSIGVFRSGRVFGGLPILPGARSGRRLGGATWKAGRGRAGDPEDGFRARLPVSGLARHPGDWEVTLPGGIRPHLDEGAAGASFRFPGGELEIARTRRNTLRIVVRGRVLVVDQVTWSADGTLCLTGSCTDPVSRPAVLVLRRRRSSEEHTVALHWDRDLFTASFSPARMPVLGLSRPLVAGRWDVLATVGGQEQPVAVRRHSLRDLPEPHEAGLHRVSVLARKTDQLTLRIETSLDDDERGAYAQARLRSGHYRRHLNLPVRDLAVFDAYKGRQYSCNPRGIYDELRRRETDIECVWVTENGQFGKPTGARTVLSGTREHYEALARARYVFGNWSQQRWFAKRDDQTYVQCWHGTPLKKLGYDVKKMPYKRTEGLNWMEHDVPQWDLLLSQNAFSVPLFRRAFAYEGEILESGYPRNDILSSPHREQIAHAVRRRLGIPHDKRIVLYAPTWRDDFHFSVGKRAFSLELDVDRFRAVLGRDHMLLLRTHYLVTDRPKWRPGDCVLDVSVYPDISELFLISDVLVTDYSSAMFDFAVTGRPMLFYTYDLERYRDHVRGFYFDFEAEAPGPLLGTSREVIDALSEPAALDTGYRAARAVFASRYCPHDDGRAASRVLDRVLQNLPSAH